MVCTSLELTISVSTYATIASGHAQEETDAHAHILTLLQNLPGTTHVEEVKSEAGQSMGQEQPMVCRVYTTKAEDAMTAAVQAVIAAGAELHNIRFSSPSLEDVFIHLTGRNIRS